MAYDPLNDRHLKLFPVDLGGRAGLAIMGPDGTYWPFPLSYVDQRRWAGIFAAIRRGRELDAATPHRWNDGDSWSSYYTRWDLDTPPRSP